MKPTIQIRVRLFSHLKYALKQDEITLTLPKGSRIEDVTRHILFLCENRLKHMPIRTALNQEFVSARTVVSDGDEVALIPPVQGGAFGIR